MENIMHIKKEKKLFNPLRLIVLLLIFLGLSFTSIALNLEAQLGEGGIISYNEDGEYIDPGGTLSIRGVSSGGEICQFTNNSSEYIYFIPTRSQVEWDAVKSVASHHNNHHLRLDCCAEGCEEDCVPVDCGDYAGLAGFTENEGRNCGPNLFNGCDWINCGCNPGDVCTIEPENLGFPDELAMIGGELKGYCRTDTGCNPVVYPSTHSQFGRIYCFADIISQGEGEPYESVISQICFDTRAKGAHSRVYHIEPHSLCWVGQHNGHTCSSYFQLPAGNDYLIVFFDETQQFIGGSNGYFVNPPADKNIQLCSQTYDESMDPPSGTCVGDSWLNCDQHEFEWECESAEGCEWEFDEDDDGPGAIRNGDGR